MKIVPHLWFAKDAKGAARFYTSLGLPDSALMHEMTLKDTPGGDCDCVFFKLWGHEFQGISSPGVPESFKFNTSMSVIIEFTPSRCPDGDAIALLDSVWEKFLSNGGTVLMKLDEYPFSKRYGWIQDHYGFSWQLIYADGSMSEPRSPILPSLSFNADKSGQAEDAMKFYRSVFSDSKEGAIVRWSGDKTQKDGTVMYGDMMIGDTWFTFFDNADSSETSTFNGSVSFLLNCENQQEIDEYWDKLSAVKEAEQCGWLMDRFGLSWQVVPTIMDEMMCTGTEEQIKRVTDTFMPMKKLEIEPLKKAFAGEAADGSPRPQKMTKTAEA